MPRKREREREHKQQYAYHCHKSKRGLDKKNEGVNLRCSGRVSSSPLMAWPSYS